MKTPILPCSCRETSFMYIISFFIQLEESTLEMTNIQSVARQEREYEKLISQSKQVKKDDLKQVLDQSKLHKMSKVSSQLEQHLLYIA